ncbi:uncharacterized protein FMAN_14190 [Fusarium mangiferae]|uniref:Uncharacterized protein n=1 Tax=Fusarium mangiferae TaxID=192010 RepID=A0A1L7ULN0_FUSMA|nr:uncharacterized protein FMAN_14190 [Fusarium mangiferae]CVL08146.1 uncharacterized protein FMAN_14190 [Fusarium mangiferae]
MEHGIGVGLVARVSFVENNVLGRITGAAHQFQTLMGVFVYDDGHARYEHEDGGHRDGTVAALIQHRDGFFLGDEYPNLPLTLLAKVKRCFDVQVPTVSIERRHHCDP